MGPRPRHLVGPGAHVPRGRRPRGPAVHQRHQALGQPPRARATAGAVAPTRGADRRQRQRRAQPAQGPPAMAGPGSTGLSGSTRMPGRSCSTIPPRSPRSPCHADFATAAPTPDHFIPLLYLAGLAGDASRGRGRARRRLRRRLAVHDRLHPRRRLPAGARRRRRRRRPCRTTSTPRTSTSDASIRRGCRRCGAAARSVCCTAPLLDGNHPRPQSEIGEWLPMPLLRLANMASVCGRTAWHGVECRCRPAVAHGSACRKGQS